MTRRRIIGLTFATLLAIGLGIGMYAAAARRWADPMRPLLQLPRFHQAKWMPDDLAARSARLVNELARQRVWSPEDAAWVEAMMRMENPPDPPAHTRDWFLPKPSASSSDIEDWLSRDGAEELTRWFLLTQQRTMAWSTVQERIRLGLNVPEPTRSFAIESWVDGLEDADEQVRVESASSLMYTRLIEDPAMRMRVEAVRLGDPIADVRAAVDRGLKHYDRFYHGIDPGGPTSECNTCP